MQQNNTIYPPAGDAPLMPLSHLGREGNRPASNRPMGSTQPRGPELPSIWTQSSPFVPAQSRQELEFYPVGEAVGIMEEEELEEETTQEKEPEPISDALIPDENVVISVQAAPPTPPAQKQPSGDMEDFLDIVSSLRMRVEALEYEIAMLHDLRIGEGAREEAE